VGSLPGLRFPTPDLVGAAAGLFPGLAVDPVASDRRFRILVAPGAVRLATRAGSVISTADDLSRSGERSCELARDRVDADVHAMRANGIAENLGATIIDRPESQTLLGRSIVEWSRKSRSAMCRTFAELDYTPIISSGRIPAMITLTYPGDWLTVAPSGKAVKRHLDLWRKRFEREYAEKARYIWKLEFQARGAPHIHLWMAPPPGPGRSGVDFRSWLSAAWADIVAHPDPVQRMRHERVGTGVDVLQGLRGSDPKRLAVYFTKHSSANAVGPKEYQNRVPPEWQGPGNGPGRFWGVYGLVKAVVEVELSERDYITARRIMRRWSRHTVAYGAVDSEFPSFVGPRTAVVMVRRVDANTGRVRYRRLRRRRKLFGRSDFGGGFALVNDGPSCAAQLGRGLIAQHL
jgi:hypothetical protein